MINRQKYIQIYILILTALIISLAQGCIGLNSQMSSSDSDIPIREDARLDLLSSDGEIIVSINVEIPENSGEIARGLIGQRSLELSEGMLFIFHDSEPRRFWMRNTRMELDIIFIDEYKKIINICSHTRPMSDNIYMSVRPARYVLEVLAGFTELYNITEGSQVNWRPF